jgi:GH24 family phage-related lysozyme (muramidase)
MGESEISVGGAVEIVQRIGNLFAHGTLQNNGERQTAMLKEYLEIKANPMLLAAREGADESVGAAARQASRLYELEKELGLRTLDSIINFDMSLQAGTNSNGSGAPPTLGANSPQVVLPGTGNISDEGLNFIAQKEGTHIENGKHTTYKDIAGIDTIGYGHVLTAAEKLKYKNGITEVEALSLLKSDATRFVNAINSSLNVNVSQNQFDAIVALSFNIGTGGFKSSSVLKFINNPNATTPYASIELSWKAWNKADGKVSQGLVNRRNYEWNLYSRGIY